MRVSQLLAWEALGSFEYFSPLFEGGATLWLVLSFVQFALLYLHNVSVFIKHIPIHYIPCALRCSCVAVVAKTYEIVRVE